MTNSHGMIRLALILLATSLPFLACRKTQSDDDEERASEPKVLAAVRIANIVSRDAPLTVDAFGKTDALRKEKIYAPIAGRIISLRAFEGSEVNTGEVIALIQSRESQAAILGAESMLQTASTPEQKAEAERSLRLAQATQNSVRVVAKFDGIVSTRLVSEGELVSENSELLTIVDLSTVNFLAEVPLRDLPSIHPGLRASVRFQALPGVDYPATVEALSPQTDTQSQTVKARLRFLPMQNPHRFSLRTEMVGMASLVTGMRLHALFIPKSALLRNDEENSYSVVTVTSDSLAVHIPVTVGTVTDSTVEVMGDGIRLGMAVICEGHYGLPDSSRVTLKQAAERE